MSRLASVKKMAPIIAIAWILSLATTLTVIYFEPMLLPLKGNEISDNAITQNQLADNAVITAKLANGSVTSAKILNGTLTAVDLADGCVITLNIADGAVTTAKIANGAVTADKLAANAVVTATLADGSVTSAKIANGAITAEDLSDGSILTIDIADGSITTSKIAAGAVTTNSLADSSVVDSKIANGTLTFDKMANGTLTSGYSFLIWTDGSTYYAKDGLTGEIESGQNATALINSVISRLPTGGTVFLCDGTYQIDNTISIFDKLNINVIGESRWDTKLNLTQGSNVDMMDITNSNYTNIQNLYFEGNRAMQTSGRGIVAYNSERVMIEGCLIYQTRQTALYIYGSAPLGRLQPWVSDNYIANIGYDNSSEGIWLGSYATDAHVVNNDVGNVNGSAIFCTSSGFLIEDNSVYSSSYGVNVFQAASGILNGNLVDNNYLDGINIDLCSNLVITGNTAKLNSYYPMNYSSGIYLYNSNFTVVSGNRAGSVGDYRNETQRYGIEEYGQLSDYNLITGNNAVGNLDSVNDIYTVGPHTLVVDNLGRYNATDNH